jgi:hypothetical protein
VLAGFLLLMGAILLVYSLASPADVFDRYLWPLFCPAAVLLLKPFVTGSIGDVRRRATTRNSILLSGALGCLVLGASVAITLNADAFDAAKWRAGQIAVAAGYKPSEVDAGYEWVSYFHPDGPSKPDHKDLRIWETLYDVGFRNFLDCSVVSSSPAGFEVLKPYATVSYKEYWLAGTRQLYVYGSVAPGCPAPPHFRSARLAALRRVGERG